MNEIVERVARAIFAREYPRASWEGKSAGYRHRKMIDARAGIAAMRLPTLNMVIAGARKAEELGHRELADEYTAMIDAAAKPE